MKAYSWPCLAIAYLTVAILSLTGCARVQQRRTNEAAPARVDFVELERKRQIHQAKLRAMSLPQLVQELSVDSKRGIEPFNSAAVNEALRRGQGIAEALRTSLTQPDASSFLALMAVRKLSSDQYALIDSVYKVAVLTDTLRTSRHFNSWGLPHLYWEEPARALIELGNLAEESMKRLLTDKRDAPVWGSEQVAEYLKYKYRVCDYARSMIMTIQGNPIKISPDPSERDRSLLQ